MENYLQWEFKQEIVRVPGNGVCFLKSVKHCLERDLDVNNTLDQISDKIFDEICDNSEIYTAIHTNSKRQLISDTLKYLNHRMYTMDIVNVVVQACANALKINIDQKCGKVMFLQVCVILFTGEGVCIPACIAGGIPACLAAGLGGFIPACIAGGIPVAGTHPTGMHSCFKYEMATRIQKSYYNV